MGGMENMSSPPNWLDQDVPILARLNLICNIIISVVITTFVALRCYAVLSSRVRLQLEDWMCLLAWFTTMAYTVPFYTMSWFGAGYPEASVSPATLISFKKTVYAASATYSPAAISTKTTLLLMIARAFASSSKPRIARGIHLFIGLLVLLFLPIQICKLAICRPIRTFWEDQSSHSHKQNDGADNSNNIMGRCLNQGILFLCDSIVAVLSDLAILLLPIYLTWSLAVAVEKKLKISVLLGAGGIAVGLTAYRLYKSWQYAQTTNLTVDYVPIAILSAGELCIGIVCACLPSVNLLLERGMCTRGTGQNRRPRRGGPQAMMQNRRHRRRHHHHHHYHSHSNNNNHHHNQQQRYYYSTSSSGGGGSSKKFASWLSSKLSTTNASTTVMWDQSMTTTTIAAAAAVAATGPRDSQHVPPPSMTQIQTLTLMPMPIMPTTTVLQVNVDVELGTITETVGEDMDMDITRGQGVSGRTRVMSIDGLREGWLAPSSIITTPTPATTTITTTTKAGGQGGGQHQSTKAKSAGGKSNGGPTSEVTFVGESVPEWDFIWDGRRTSFTDTRLRELRHQRSP